MSIQNISISIKRSKGAVENAIKRTIGGSLKKRIGAKPKRPQRYHREIVHIATLKKSSDKGTACVSNKKVSFSTVTHALNNCNITQYVKMNKNPPLSKRHQTLRREAILSWIKSNCIWQNVIFSDEKIFNLDVPDVIKQLLA